MADRRREKEKPRDRDAGDLRDRDREVERSRSRDREVERSRDRDRDRDRNRERESRKRSRSPDHRRHGRSPSIERPHRRNRRSPSPDGHRRKRRKDASDDDAVASDRRRRRHDDEPKKKPAPPPSPDSADLGADVHADMDPDEVEMMKKLGIPVGFDSTKGKPVAGNNTGAVRVVTKRQPRQYMNRRGGFNRPLPAELNRIACVAHQVGQVHRTHSQIPGYYDGRYWTLWKLPMFGCTDPSQVLTEIDECKKAYPNAYIRLLSFDNKQQCQCMSFVIQKPTTIANA